MSSSASRSPSLTPPAELDLKPVLAPPAELESKPSVETPNKADPITKGAKAAKSKAATKRKSPSKAKKDDTGSSDDAKPAIHSDGNDTGSAPSSPTKRPRVRATGGSKAKKTGEVAPAVADGDLDAMRAEMIDEMLGTAYSQLGKKHFVDKYPFTDSQIHNMLTKGKKNLRSKIVDSVRGGL